MNDVNFEKKNILILEDSLTQAVELEYILEQGGYSSTTVINGVEALKYLNDSNNIRPDIIISDIVMPEMSGFEFCKELKLIDHLKKIPVILLTSLSDAKDIISGLECGADNFITKPYKSEYLLSRIKQVIANFEIRIKHPSDGGINIQFAGNNYIIKSDRIQILDLLVSSFENAVEKNTELNLTIQNLNETQRELLKTKDLLNKLASSDALTKIFNRRAFKEIATKLLSLAIRKKRSYAILHLDLDNFKLINDTLGHKAGDEVLKETAAKLTNILRGEDITGRIGGDEFAVVLIDFEDDNGIDFVANKIIESFKKSIKIKGEDIFVTLSLGIAILKEGSISTYAELLQKADMAMYEAKRSGKSQYRFYNKQIKAKHERHQNLEKEIDKALRDNEFSMVYQPIIDLSNNSIVGFESLIRWKNGILGTVCPDEFITFAENTKQIHEIGNWIINEVMRQCSIWDEKSLKNKFITINVSPVQFERKAFISLLNSCFVKYKQNTERIVIEITETAFSQFLKAETLLGLTDNDIPLAIDDFGSGYSSMQRLLELPVDYLKIDGSAIKDLANSEKHQGVVKNILSIARSINVKTIAECVETKEQAEFLIEYGCDYAQGYFYSKPLNSDDVIKFL